MKITAAPSCGREKWKRKSASSATRMWFRPERAGRINRMLPGNSFEFIITSSNYIFRKPSKRIFDLALEKSGLNPDETWYIGDQYECDIKGALNAGIFPVWYIGAIDLPYKDDKNILTVKTWDKLMEIMSVS